MSYRCLAAVFTVIAVVALTPMFTAAQSAEPPRTPWGAPDLQGVWDFRSITPMERPEELADKEFLTEEEAANLEQEAADRNERLANQPAQRTQVADSVDRREDGGPGFYNNFWLDRGTNTVGTRRTSLIVDPADGRIPPLTLAGAQRREARSARPDVPAGPEDLPFIERCYLGFNSGPPIVPSAYNNNMQLFQTPDYVVILTEMVHEARIVPLDGRPPLPASLRQWLGDSRGRWEGDTLVIDTRNFLGETSLNPKGTRIQSGSAANMHLVERFTRVEADTLLYEFTVDDPTTWTRSWTAAVPMRRSAGPIFEYACHEGNYGLYNILAGARVEEAAAEAATPGSK